jgi:hypothetical protein
MARFCLSLIVEFLLSLSGSAGSDRITRKLEKDRG